MGTRLQEVERLSAALRLAQDQLRIAEIERDQVLIVHTLVKLT
jgi:hypothetical protein